MEGRVRSGGSVDGAAAVAVDAVGERLAGAGVRALAMTMVDNGGVTRTKVAPMGRLGGLARRGVGMSKLWAVAAVDDRLASVPPYDSATGDLRLVPDLDAARPLAAAAGWGWAPVDQLTQELEPAPACQRAALKRAVARGRALGLEFRATYEIEMSVFDAEGRPIHDGPGYSARALLPLQPFALELMEALDAQGIEVEQCHAEHAAGQFELSLAPRDPLAAADETVLARITIQQVARAHGMRVSFAPVAILGASPNGCHLHLSAWRDGTNLMQGGSGAGGLQPEGASLLGGVLAALPALLAVLCPSVLSYARLQPGLWAGAHGCWGVENREAALRLQPGAVSSRGQSANVEVKTVDGAANPYLALGVVLAAALDGLERGVGLPEPVQVDPGTVPDEARAAHGLTALPTSLDAATDLLESSADARAALGQALHATFVGVRRLESTTYGAASPEALADALRWRY